MKTPDEVKAILKKSEEMKIGLLSIGFILSIYGKKSEDELIRKRSEEFYNLMKEQENLMDSLYTEEIT